jgi:tRNA dimethylallyltransferase
MIQTNLSKASKYLIVIVGPTAIGKTALSIELAKHYGCAIFSADSRQFYAEMTIGTAKPSQKEMQGIPHFFVGHKSIQEEYNAGRFEKEALFELDRYFEGNDLAILVGGSGLYVNAVCYGIDDIPKDSSIRDALQQQLERDGLESLQEELKRLDPEHYANSNVKNPQRVIRALEVCRLTGKTYTSFRSNEVKTRPFTTIMIGLDAPRDILYERINLRVDNMVTQGLVQEVNGLLPFRHLNALNTVGYKEFFDHLDGLCTLHEAIEKVKQNTRNFAKRQLTWFRKDKSTHWVRALDHPFDHSVAIVDHYLDKHETAL